MFRDIEADCYIMVDGDDTYPAEDAYNVAKLVLENKADMAIGDRLSSTYFRENKRPFHNTGNKLVRTLINKIFKSEVKDIMTGCRAFNRKFVKSFPVLSNGFEIETEMSIHALDKRFLIAETPIAYRDRPEGSESKLNTFQDGYRVLKTILKLYKDYKPLSFFGLIALLLFLLGSVMMIPVLSGYFKTGLVPRYPTLIFSGFMLMIAIILFACGLILEVVVKKHRQLFELMLINTKKNEE